MRATLLKAAIASVDPLLSATTMADLRSDPAFSSAALDLAAGSRALDAAADRHSRWLTRDLGRASLYLAALILNASWGAVATHDLIAAAAATGACSRGRVLAFVAYARDAGLLEVPDGPGPWTRRPLQLAPAFFTYGEARFWRGLESAALVFPEAERALALRGDPRAFAAALVIAGQLTVVRSDLFAPPVEPLAPFLNRDAGQRILFEWMLASPDPGRPLLTQVRLERTALARRTGVSRAHLNALIAESEAAGFIQLPGSGDWVVFSPALSAALESHLAKLLSMHRAAAVAALAACNPEAPKPAR